MTRLPEYIRTTVRQRRIAVGMTPAELAARSGSERDTIYAIEAGIRRPSLAFLERLCDALNLEFLLVPAGGED